MMNHHDIHEIITQISQSLDCPECKTRILPHNINITDIVDSDCMFDVVCHRCKTEMTLSAHVEKTPAEESLFTNESSRMFQEQMMEEPVSMADVEAVRYELRHFCGSFIETFCR
jgi:DNA-directed RNA polymerase subunit RPC12/RpoP